MAPVRDREGERRGWYWLEDEAYLFLAGGVRSFGWTEKVFDTKIGILVSAKTCPSFQMGFPTQAGLKEPRRNLSPRHSI